MLCENVSCVAYSRHESSTRVAVCVAEDVRHRTPKLSYRQVVSPVNMFTAWIPERRWAMAALQGYSINYKPYPLNVIAEASA